MSWEIRGDEENSNRMRYSPKPSRTLPLDNSIVLSAGAGGLDELFVVIGISITAGCDVLFKLLLANCC